MVSGIFAVLLILFFQMGNPAWAANPQTHPKIVSPHTGHFYFHLQSHLYTFAEAQAACNAFGAKLAGLEISSIDGQREIDWLAEGLMEGSPAWIGPLDGAAVYDVFKCPALYAGGAIAIPKAPQASSKGPCAALAHAICQK